MHVLIVGGTRFVGLLPGWRLLAQGHRVTPLDRGRVYLELRLAGS